MLRGASEFNDLMGEVILNPAYDVDIATEDEICLTITNQHEAWVPRKDRGVVPPEITSLQELSQHLSEASQNLKLKLTAKPL